MSLKEKRSPEVRVHRGEKTGVPLSITISPVC